MPKTLNFPFWLKSLVFAVSEIIGKPRVPHMWQYE